jgi:hypothetical protein
MRFGDSAHQRTGNKACPFDEGLDRIIDGIIHASNDAACSP